MIWESLLMEIKLFILLFLAASGSAMANIPIKYKTVWDGQVEPVSVYANSGNVIAIEPKIDTSQEDKLYQSYLAELNRIYAPKVNFYLYLPLDIADTRIRSVKVGFESKAELSAKGDKISVYLMQNKEAQHYMGLYRQRIIGWHEGKAPFGMTIGKAVAEEATFPILDIVLTPETTTPERLKYFEQRLSLQHLSALHGWIATTEDVKTTMTLADIIARSLVNQKLNLGN